MRDNPYDELEARIQQAIAEDDFSLCDEDGDLTEEGITQLARIAVAQTQNLVNELWENFQALTPEKEQIS
jgi:hypothetical protein